MRKTLVDIFNAMDDFTKFKRLPKRIFLDTNVLQYLQDFSEYIFDNHRENENYFLSPRGKRISRNDSLYNEIVALKNVFLGIDRTNFEFALSETVFKEVAAKHDDAFYRWFCDVRAHWYSVMLAYQGHAFSKTAIERYQQASHDKSLLANLSITDRKIILDAIRFDCNALLTVDKFADKNKQIFTYTKYRLMILKPTDFIRILQPFQALYL